MNGQEEVDEFGIPIKKKKPEAKKQEVDEFGIPIKKKEPTGKGSGTGTTPTSPSKSPSPSVKKVNLQDMVAGVKPATSEVDVEVQERRTQLPMQPPPVRREGIGLTPPETPEPQAPEFVQEEEMPAFQDFGVAKENLTEIQEKTMTTEELGQMRGEQVEEVDFETSPKFRKNPDGTYTVRGSYYGYETGEEGDATPNEKLAAKGFYYNKQSDKEGRFDIFSGNADDIFIQYENDIVNYINELERTSPKLYSDFKGKVEAGNFTQFDQYKIISSIEAKKIANLERDIMVLSERVESGEEGYEPMLEQKALELQDKYLQYENLIKFYPQLAEKQWKQEVLETRWKEAEGFAAVPLWIGITGAKTENMLSNVINGTGQFILRTAQMEDSADAWNNFWDGGLTITPATPIINEDGSINWANASTEIVPQVFQMYLVFSGSAGKIQEVLNVATKGAVSQNAGLFTAGYLATYKDLYDQAKEANLSNDDANLYASLVGLGVAGAELIMPDRNFFAAGADDYLRFIVQESAKGTKGAALRKALVNYIKKVGAENVEEFTQDLISNASAVMTDAAVDGTSFDQELFSRDGILGTMVVTTLTAGLAGGGSFIQDAKKRRRSLYQLANNYESFQEQLSSLVESGNVTEEQAQRLTQEVEAVRQAQTKVPPQMPEEQKIDVVPMVAEKDKLEEEKKNLDPVFQPPVQQQIDEINSEIIRMTQPELVAEQEEKTPAPKTEETTPAPTQEIAIGDEIKFTQGQGEFAKERQGTVSEIREDGSYVTTFKVGGEETTAIVKPENIIRDAIQEQSSIEVPLQPEAGVSEKVEEGKSKAKPEVSPKEGEEVKSEEVQQEEVEKVSEKAGVSPKNLRELYQVNRDLFGLNKVKSLASAVTMDRMIGAMSKRVGVSKKEMYDKIEFRKAEEKELPTGVKYQVEAWHGSPHQFDRFSAQAIGTGEGAQAFGWGLYFTDIEVIAKNYAKKLSLNQIKEAFLKEIPQDASEEEVMEVLGTGVFTENQEAVITALNNDDWLGFDYPAQAIQAAYAGNLDDYDPSAELKEAISKTRSVYKVSLHKGKTPEQYNWLEWDKPISVKAKEAINKMAIDSGDDNEFIGYTIQDTQSARKPLSISGTPNGRTVYENISTQLGTDQKASLFLLEAGIDGIKYPAESIARGTTSDNARGFNYVVFDENAVGIEEVIKFQKDAGKARGAMMMTMDGSAIVYALTDPNVSTPLHELAHVFEHYLTDAERKSVLRWANAKEWNIEVSEKFARGFEKYLADGKPPVPSLQKVFDRFKEWLADIYEGISGSDIDINLNKKMKEIYSSMLGEEKVGMENQTLAPENGVNDEVTIQKEERAKSFGYDNPFQLVQSINKNLDKNYTIDDFENIPESEIKEAASKSATVVKNKERQERVAKIEENITGVKERLAQKIKESRGKMQSGIDPSILPDLLELGKLYVEKGLIKAADFIAQMRQDMADMGITDVTDEQIKSELFDQILPEKPAEGKKKESGRSKTIREGRMPIANEEMRKRIEEDKSFYQVYGNEQAKSDSENFFSQFDKIDEGNWREVADEISRVDALSNPWLLVARDIHVANGFALVEKLQSEGKAKEAESLADSALDFFNKSAKIATQAGKLTGNLNMLRAMSPEQMLLFFTRALNRSFNSSSVIKRRKKAAREDIKIIKDGIEANQRQTAQKIANGIRGGKVAPEVKSKAKGKNPNAYKPKIKEANDKISKGLDLLRKSASNMTSGGLSPEALEGVKLILEGLIIKGSVNINRLYGSVRNMVNDNLKQDLSREDFDALYEDSGLEKIRLEVEKQKLEGDKYLKSKVKEQIKARDILADLTYDYYSGNKNGTDGVVSAMQEELGLTEAEAQSIKRRLDTIFEQILVEENNKLLRKKFRKNKKSSGKKVEDASRKFAEYVQAGVLDTEYMLEQLKELYGIDSITSDDISKLKELSEKYFRANIFKDEIAVEIADFISNKAPVSSFDIYQGFWYASVLSGPGTQITNIWGNLNLLASEFSVNKTADLVGAVTRKDGTIHAPNKETAKRLISMMTLASNMTWEVFRNGATSNKYIEERSTQFKKEFTVERLSQYRGGNKFASISKSIIRGVYTPVKYILRGLEAFDQGFGSVAFDAEANVLLNRLHKKNGLRGKELQQQVYNELYGSDVIKQEALEEVLSEMKDLGLNLNDTYRIKKGIATSIRSKMDPAILAQSKAFAAKITLKGAPTGVAGIVARGITNMNNTIKFTRFIVPFVNVPFNMLNRWIDWVPGYGLARAYGYGVSSIMEKRMPDTFTKLGVKPSKAVSRREMEQAWARQILSIALTSGLYALTQMTYTDDDGEEKPILEFSGGRTYLDFKARIDSEKYMPEYSMRFMGGEPISYKLSPMAPILLFMGESRDRELFKEDRPFEREFSDKSVLYGMIMSKFFLDSAPLQGLEQLWESIDRFATSKEQESTKFINLVGKVVVKQGTTVVEPNLYGQVVKIFDPKSYSPQDINQMIYKGLNISFLDEESSYYFDGFGRAIKYYPSERYFPVQHIFGGKGEDKVDLLMVKHGVYPSDVLGRMIPYKSEIIDYDGKVYNAKQFKDKFTEAYELEGLAGKSQEKYMDALKEMSDELPDFAFISTRQWQDMAMEVGKRAYNEIKARYAELDDMEGEDFKEEIKQIYKNHFQEYVSENFDKLKESKK